MGIGRLGEGLSCRNVTLLDSVVGTMIIARVGGVAFRYAGADFGIATVDADVVGADLAIAGVGRLGMMLEL